MEFTVGKTYFARSACNYDCIFEYKVLKRTAKFITIEDKFGDTKRVGISNRDGIEKAKPEGTYSMCPVISADRELAAA